MRETGKRRLRGMSRSVRRAYNPLAIERLEGRLTLSHTPLAPVNDFESFDAHPHGLTGGPGPEAGSAYYGTMQAPSILNAPMEFVGPRSIIADSSPMAAPMIMRAVGMDSTPMPHMSDPVSTLHASSTYGTFALSTPEPSVQLALIVPASAQFDPLLVVIVDRSIVDVMPARLTSPMNFMLRSLSTDSGQGYGGGDYAHFDGTSSPPGKPGGLSGDGPARGLASPAAYVALPQGMNSHSGGEVNGPSDNGLAGRISAGLGAGGASHFVIQVLPNLTIPSGQQHAAATVPSFGMLLPPADVNTPQREPGAPDGPNEADIAAQATAEYVSAQTAEQVAMDASSPAAEVARTAAMLEGISLRIDAVDQALEGALVEIERLGGDLVSWLGEFGLGSWAAPTSAAVALSAGAYFGLRSARRSTDDEHEEESSSWLFSRLQTHVGPA